MKPLEQYLTLEKKWLETRDTLTQAEEDDILYKLDELWWKLSDEAIEMLNARDLSERSFEEVFKKESAK